MPISALPVLSNTYSALETTGIVIVTCADILGAILLIVLVYQSYRLLQLVRQATSDFHRQWGEVVTNHAIMMQMIYGNRVAIEEVQKRIDAQIPS